MELKRAKGTRDSFYGEEILRKNVLKTLETTFRLYGFNPLETPVLESYETLATKYGGGAEILREVFTLSDQGRRELGLRYDLTVPLARFIAMNPQLKMPVKRYEIGKVFRDGPTTMGRQREFYQCDADIVGVKNITADAEIISLARQAFKKLNLDVVIKINNRKILDKIMDLLEIPKKKQPGIILSVDKLGKIGIEGVREELVIKGLKKGTIQRLFEILLVQGRNKDKLKYLQRVLGECDGLNEIERLLSYIGDAEFDVSLARGLNYYTGTVYEIFAKNKNVKGSLAAGGRYDAMIGDFVGKGDYPAIGISFGLEPIAKSLESKKLEPKKTTAVLYVIPIKTFEKSFEIMQQLRSLNIPTDIDFNDRGITKNLEYASTLGIPYVLIVGQRDLVGGQITLRNMISGREEKIKLADLSQQILHLKT